MEIYPPGHVEPLPDEETPAQQRKRRLSDIGLFLLTIAALASEVVPFVLAIWLWQ
ncbi:hypothetical protein [Rhizobium rhizoryzae]|uniref:hypothetical protein n=1 Tax=Rhizobium rhizoryzae TaxID=451876 RepID=UPI00289E9864|nr:hypothetical protein [Rhizobium rhizoryzae]